MIESQNTQRPWHCKHARLVAPASGVEVLRLSNQDRFPDVLQDRSGGIRLRQGPA